MMLTKRVPYTFNRGGYYYFTRRVPVDLLPHYRCPRIVQGLATKSPSAAKTRAMVAAAKLDEYWSHLRMVNPDLVGMHLLRQPDQVANSTNNVVESREGHDEHTTLVGDSVSTGRWKDSPNAQLTKKKAALLRPHIFIFKSYWTCSGDKIHITGSGSIDRASVRRKTNAALPWLSARSKGWPIQDARERLWDRSCLSA